MQIISEIKKNVNLFSQFPSFLVYALGNTDCTGGADQTAQVAAYAFCPMMEAIITLRDRRYCMPWCRERYHTTGIVKPLHKYAS